MVGRNSGRTVNRFRNALCGAGTTVAAWSWLIVIPLYVVGGWGGVLSGVALLAVLFAVIALAQP